MDNEGYGVDVLEESIKRVVCIEDGKPSLAANAQGLGAEVFESEKVVSMVVPQQEEKPGADAGVEETAAVNEASDSDSEDDLQLIVNDEDFFYPHGVEGTEEAEGEEIYVVPGDERYGEVDWSAEMHYHHSQFKYVRPGSGAATASPGIQDGTPAAKGQQPVAARNQVPFMPDPYMMGQWGLHAFEPCYEFVLPPSKSVFDIDLDQFEDKPWDYAGVDITDYFNFGFTEESWKQYCEELERVKSEMPMNGKARGYENGHQAYEKDGFNLPSQRSRGHGSRGMRHQNGRAIQVDGGGQERRPSVDMRRQRLRDSGSIIQIPLQDETNDGVRRRQRNDDFFTPYPQRRRDFLRQGEHLPAGGRRMSAGSVLDHSSGGMYGSPVGSRSSNYPARRPPPSVPSSMDNSGRPWRKFSRGDMDEEQAEEDDGRSNGSSDSKEGYQHERNEDEYYDHRVRHQMDRGFNEEVAGRRGRLATERRLIEEREKRMLQPLVDRRLIASGHHQEKAPEKRPVVETKTQSPPRVSERVSVTDKRSQLLTERKRSWQVLSEKRLGRLPTDDEYELETKHATSPPPAESRRPQQLAERRPAAQAARRSTQPAKEPSPEPVAEKRQSRAELIAERRAAQLIARKQLAQAIAEETSVQVTTEKVVRESKSVTHEVKTSTVTTTIKKVDPQPRVRRQESSGKDDLRMKVLERVSARWKMHLRMDDAQAKRKRDNSNKVVMVTDKAKVDREEEETGSHREAVDDRENFQLEEEQVQDDDVGIERTRRRKERREERKYRHKERKEDRRARLEISEERDYDEFDDYNNDVKDRAGERWQMDDDGEYRSSRAERGHRKSKKRKRYGEEEEDLEDSRRRSSSRSHSRRHREDYDDVDYDEEQDHESAEQAEEYDNEWDGDRWTGYEDSARSSKRRRYSRSDLVRDHLDEHEADYDYDRGGDDYESMSPGDDYYQKDRDSRWTGSLQESDEDEYGRYEA